MNKEELALEVLKLTYRHDLKTCDAIEKAQALFDWITKGSEQASAGVQKKKPGNN